MNRLELINLLSSSTENEVFIKKPTDLLLDDIEVEHIDEVFDGFDTAYPACIALKIKGHDK